MKEIFAYNYNNERVGTGIDLDSVDFITVTILTGDEVLFIHRTDGTETKFDSCPDRIEDFFDGRYRVSKDQLEQWMKRKDSYDWGTREMMDSFFGPDWGERSHFGEDEEEEE